MSVPTTKAEKRRHAAGAAAAKKLELSTKAVQAYLRACNDCNDGSGDEQRGISDGRHMLIREMSEYAVWLDAKYRIV